jgi:hypothetical protein
VVSSRPGGIKRSNIMEELKEIKTKLDHIEKLLMGNGGVGVAEMARRAFEYCQQHKQSKNGLLDWSFRAVIMITLSFIAVRVGIK